MNIRKSFKIALNIILHSKLRSWLTILGIVIGIAAVVSIVSVGQGAQRSVAQNLNSLSANILTVSSGFSRASGTGVEFRGGGGFGGGFGQQSTATTIAKNLTVKDVQVLNEVPNVEYATGIVSGSVDSSFLAKSTKLNVEGVDPAVWKNFISTSLSSGRYLTQGDIGLVVIGNRIATSVFTNLDLGRQLTLGTQSFKVVGILAASGNGDDNRVFMPIQDAVNVIADKNAKSFDSISIKIKDISLTNDTINQLTNRLMLSHNILQTSKQDFSITSPLSLQQRVSSTLSSLSLFLTAIAAISLIVGAIGIMNSMFTSVLERTREIGILKALGAKNSDILTIFLLNSGIIGLIGGILGVLLGIFASSYIGQLASGTNIGRFSLSSAYINPTLVIGVFILSIVVGLIAGAIPAYNASKLKPVDALRYE